MSIVWLLIMMWVNRNDYNTLIFLQLSLFVRNVFYSFVFNMQKFWQIMKRLLIVLYFIITIPICISWIYEFDKDYLRDHSFYFSMNSIKEKAWILREWYSLSTPLENKNEIITLWDKEIIAYFLEANPTWADYLNRFKPWYYHASYSNYYSSANFATDLNTNWISPYDTLKFQHWIYFILMIFISLGMIIAYIIVTDLLAKTWWYIIDWKFSWWIDYPKLLNSIKQKLSKDKY